MSVDPLSIATSGFFTCASANCNPCTLATDGYIVVGGDEGGAGKKRKKTVHLSKKEFTEMFGEDGKQVEVQYEKPATFIQPLPVNYDAESVNTYTEDRELARLIRLASIKRHAELELKKLEEEKIFKNKLSLMVIMALEDL